MSGSTSPKKSAAGAGSSATTPMFRQWQEAKSQYPDALLLFRMGDFYELFFEDARQAAPILDIALTTRGKGTATAAPMCGVPHHSVTSYVGRLVERGHRVAICEQMEDPRKVKGMVRREVVRVISPGTQTDPELLDPGVGQFLASVAPSAGDGHGVALIDLSTGGLIVTRAEDDRALGDLLARYEVREVLVPAEAPDAPRLPEGERAGPLVTTLDEDLFHPALAAGRVREALGVHSLASFGCDDGHPGLPAAAAALAHLRRTQRVQAAHLDRLRVDDPRRILLMDRATRRNLELVTNLVDSTRRNTVLEALDRTLTPMGARALRARLLEPLVDLDAIRARHAFVEVLVARADLRARAREALREIRDIERLLGRAALSRATAHDLASLRGSLGALPELRAALEAAEAPATGERAARIDPIHELRDTLEVALADEPTGVPGEGRVLREGYDGALDECRELARGSRRLIAEIESRERERTGIGSLKVRYNKVFGYFIEVSRANLSRVPDDYERRQTLANGERFVTPEIKDLEQKILSAEERLAEREKELFEGLVHAVCEQTARLKETAAAVADVDALAGLAEVAAEQGYVRPEMTDEDVLEIEDGRHPVVERLMSSGEFVPNDCRLADDRRLLVVTGPNMGGKSTFLRQVALIVLMAQAGSFVPARSARVGLADRIFCRVGASDNLAGGESTFMVEMTETANILHNATPASLVLLDEIGRGTATWDGMAIAWAVVEHLLEDARLRPKALFATHYHELTELAAELPGLDNVHIGVREHGRDIVFLHRVEPGPSDRSYGIHVARLAGLPDRVVGRARELLERISAEHASPAELVHRQPGPRQLPLFAAQAAPDPAAEGVLEELRAADPDGMTPREAHDLLRRWRSTLDAPDPEGPPGDG
jgi:DNA mismatch repair protein MutS